METKSRKLKTFNFAMAGLHAVQGTLMLILSKDFKLPIQVGFLDFDKISSRLFPASHEVFQLPLAWLIAGFLFMSALAHLLIATVYNKTYNENLKKGLNKVRWVEYAFSASTMMVAIAMLVGIYDLGSLIMIFTLVAIMNLLGLVMEIHNQITEKTNWISYYIGCFAGAVPWIVVGLFFWAANQYGSGQIPTFVYWIYVSIFLFFNCFAVNMVLQYKKVGKWQEYLYGERVYILLSLIAKSLLAWQVFAGTLRP
jgi:hypothetical protein